MNDDLALRAIETRIDAALFDRRYWTRGKWRGDVPRNVYARHHLKSDIIPLDRIEITPAEAAADGWICGHYEYCSDWSTFPRLLDRCVQRGWWFSSWHDLTAEPWRVKLVFSQDGSFGPDELWLRRGRGDSLPLALCRAVVAVLDATEESAKVEDES